MTMRLLEFCGLRRASGVLASVVGTAYNECMQYTIRGVPPEVDRAIRQRAKERGKSLNEALVEALTEAVGLAEQPRKRRDMSDLVGTWHPDRELLEALADQRRIDEDMWR